MTSARRFSGSAAYRARQFFRGFRCAISPDELAVVRELLTGPEASLFVAMHARDRRHSMDMLLWLRARTEPSRDLLVATLLHDVGKGPLHVWDRVLYVLLRGISTRLTDVVAAERGWQSRRALWVLRDHARLGAETLRAAGCSSRVVTLVEGHTDPEIAGDAELRWLRAADDAS
jgi:hypothetical protein